MFKKTDSFTNAINVVSHGSPFTGNYKGGGRLLPKSFLIYYWRGNYQDIPPPTKTTSVNRVVLGYIYGGNHIGPPDSSWYDEGLFIHMLRQ